jgi:NADH dehydrogenase/NADH:ubiquinone oxidoreductase subunit G
LLTFNNDLFIYDTGSEFRQKVEKMKVIAIGTHDNAVTKMAAIAIPVASYSESSGSVINSDGILQHFSKAVRKNTPLPDMIWIAGIAGSPIVTESDIASEMKKVLPSLTEVIPEGGLKLTESEAAHVPA